MRDTIERFASTGVETIRTSDDEIVSKDRRTLYNKYIVAKTSSCFWLSDCISQSPEKHLASSPLKIEPLFLF